MRFAAFNRRNAQGADASLAAKHAAQDANLAAKRAAQDARPARPNASLARNQKSPASPANLSNAEARANLARWFIKGLRPEQPGQPRL